MNGLRDREAITGVSGQNHRRGSTPGGAEAATWIPTRARDDRGGNDGEHHPPPVRVCCPILRASFELARPHGRIVGGRRKWNARRLRTARRRCLGPLSPFPGLRLTPKSLNDKRQTENRTERASAQAPLEQHRTLVASPSDPETRCQERTPFCGSFRLHDALSHSAAHTRGCSWPTSTATSTSTASQRRTGSAASTMIRRCRG